MIPAWLTEKLAHPPAAGAGIHAWLFSVARQLHAHMSPSGVAAAITAAVESCGRRVTAREIRDAVTNSRAVMWTRKADRVSAGGDEVRSVAAGQPAQASGADTARWPAVDHVARRCRIRDSRAVGVACMYSLWESSPVRPDGMDPDDWIETMFPGAEWLCLAKDHPATARSRRTEKWTFGAADECGLIVPSPMTGPSGKALDGHTAHRCLGNTGPRRWLVVEFDTGSVDEQAALHWHLGESAAANGWPRLVLCVSSGGKSAHGWYGPCADEENSRALMEYAVHLGADPATWNRCQLVRLPEGRRKREPAVLEYELPDDWPLPPAAVTQHVYFFDPAPLLTPCNSTNTNSSAPGAPSGLTPAHAPTAA